ncbi:hypothetical protein EJ02DRAFT_433919 [Clathrospora elynae]|uniref:Uncharacterized protein n=1 Tax=Clathrospora elynae TaxID=706981 RepID=A0A6A5SRS1_9PLEO|nr:hypothetical protein EJ02DRAFT_433919 [Clathrospora elynae]
MANFTFLALPPHFGRRRLQHQLIPQAVSGSIYFTADPVDGLLFQNPDLYHDLHVFKCVTTVVLNTGSRGEAANYTRMLERERGLEEAYKWMAGLPSKIPDLDAPIRNETTIQLGKHNISASLLPDMPNLQILYLRLPDSTHGGQGYPAYNGESLRKLYYPGIQTITSTDGTNNTYTAQDLNDVIAMILQFRQASNIHVLSYQDELSPDDNDVHSSEHADHIMSARIVMWVIKREKMEVKVQSYASDLMRSLAANINVTSTDYRMKTDAYLKYAAYDANMCHSLEECDDRYKKAKPYLDQYGEVDYVSAFLERAYYVVDQSRLDGR